MNIFVIEDEPPILREIVSVIESFHEDYQIIGKAQNGKDALAFLETNGENIDVMITDIQIPVVTGLDLIAWTKKHFPGILSIILTGYSRFSYAQEAIRYGSFGYLLKPIDENELQDLLRKAYVQKCSDYIRNIPMTDSRKYSPSESASSRYQAVLISISVLPMYTDFYSDLFPEQWESLNLPSLFESDSSFQNHFWIINSSVLSEKIILFQNPDNSQDSSADVLTSVLTPLTESKIPVTVIIDTQFLGIRGIHATVLKLRHFAGRHAHFEKSQLFIYQKEENTAAEKDLSVFRPCRQRLSDLFVRQNIPVFGAELHNYLDIMRSMELPASSVYLLLQDLFFSLIQASNDSLDYFASSVQSTAADALMLSDSYDILYDNLRSICLSLFEAVLQTSSDADDKNLILLKVDSYIKKHFTEPVNTKSIAKQFGFTPAYLSKIFREFKSLTPADYIVKLRMEKAEEILAAHPDIRVRDVASSVGYEDSLYFSKVFKKTTGLSPKQFQDGHSGF